MYNTYLILGWNTINLNKSYIGQYKKIVKSNESNVSKYLKRFNYIHKRNEHNVRENEIVDEEVKSMQSGKW